MHTRKSEMLVTIDIAGRRVTMENDDESGLGAARERYARNAATKGGGKRGASSTSNQTKAELIESMTTLQDELVPQAMRDCAGISQMGSFSNNTLHGRTRRIYEAIDIRQAIASRAKDGAAQKGLAEANSSAASASTSSRSQKATTERGQAQVARLTEELAPWRGKPQASTSRGSRPRVQYIEDDDNADGGDGP